MLQRASAAGPKMRTNRSHARAACALNPHKASAVGMPRPGFDLHGFAGHDEIPRLAGQNYDYIVKQLTDFKARKRTNDAGNMTSVANTLSAQDIENIAHFVSGL